MNYNVDWDGPGESDDFECPDCHSTADPCECCKCHTCNGTGQVNPLTPNLPKDFLCLGADECPSCDGTGEIL